MLFPSPSRVTIEYFEIHVYQRGRRTPAYLSAENKVVFCQCQANWFNSAADAYRVIKRLPKGMGVFSVEHIVEYINCAPSSRPCPDFIRDMIDEIPLPYSLTAVAWAEGADVRKEPVVFGPLPPSTFYRHRKKLLAYGIDIGKPSNLRVLR